MSAAHRDGHLDFYQARKKPTVAFHKSVARARIRQWYRQQKQKRDAIQRDADEAMAYAGEGAADLNDRRDKQLEREFRDRVGL